MKRVRIEIVVNVHEGLSIEEIAHAAAELVNDSSLMHQLGIEQPDSDDGYEWDWAYA